MTAIWSPTNGIVTIRLDNIDDFDNAFFDVTTVCGTLVIEMKNKQFDSFMKELTFETKEEQ